MNKVLYGLVVASAIYFDVKIIQYLPKDIARHNKLAITLDCLGLLFQSYNGISFLFLIFNRDNPLNVINLLFKKAGIRVPDQNVRDWSTVGNTRSRTIVNPNPKSPGTITQTIYFPELPSSGTSSSTGVVEELKGRLRYQYWLLKDIARKSVSARRIRQIGNAGQNVIFADIWRNRAEYIRYPAEVPKTKGTEVIVGYRLWNISKDKDEKGRHRLTSLYMDDIWTCGEVFTGQLIKDAPCVPPGIHAYSSIDKVLEEIDELESRSPQLIVIVGTVSLWGTVVICEDGYRATQAYPNQLFWTNYVDPQINEKVLTHLCRNYGIERYISNEIQ